MRKHGTLREIQYAVIIKPLLSPTEAKIPEDGLTDKCHYLPTEFT